METLLLERTKSGLDATFGVIFKAGVPMCLTLELPWKDNQHDISCIPPGRYTCKKIFSPHFQKELFELQNVPGRGNVEIHIGNSVSDTHGCILLGMGFAFDKPMIQSSTIAFENFMATMSEDFELVII